MTTPSGACRKRVIGIVLGALILGAPVAGRSQERSGMAIETQATRTLQLTVKKSLVLTSGQPIKRLSLADPEVADTIIISPRQVYLSGKTMGATRLTLWGENGRVFDIIDVDVLPDVTQLKRRLQEILPGEAIQVTASHDAITLFGEVSSTAKLSQAIAMAEAYAPNDNGSPGTANVINLLQVAGVHQVMLEVRMAEVSRSLTRRLGINFSAVTAGATFGVSLLNNLTSLGAVGIAPNTPAPSAIGVNPLINALFRFEKGGVTWTTFIDALKESGLAKILAEPTLVTLSGQEASFLAGGEFPIPIAQRDNTITIEFKPFGVALSFTPTVLSNKRINMKVAPEVSELDFANAITTTGIVIPALTLRRASTVIELADGQSFAIAGLLREDVREIVSKFPVLGDIPILGALFRSSAFQKNDTELLIIVTPHLVKPLLMAKQTLPTDAFVEPTDAEFYLYGRLEGTRQKEAARGRLDGSFGYIVGPLLESVP